MIAMYVVYIYGIIISYAIVFRKYGVIDATTGAAHHDEVTCIYFSIVTWTTLGYGDFRPSVPMRLVAASEALLGYFMMAVFVAGVIGTLATPQLQGSKTVGLPEGDT
jgi:hypothetical protein